VNVAEDGHPYVAACYIVQDRRLLMVQRRFRHGAPEWAGPSGNVETGETPEETAVREVREEVGLTVEVTRRLGDRVHPATGRHLIYFSCRIVAGEAAVVDDEEITAVEWCELPTVLERWSGIKGGIYPPVREYLDQVMGI
jgi:8-oxo-dGTP diphosphatase